jgi:hypothetical protein
MFTITWVYTYQRSKEEYFKGKNEQSNIDKMYKTFKDAKDAYGNRELNREETKILMDREKDYYQTVTRATTAYDTSIHSYTPFNEYVMLSLSSLDEIGEFCIQKNDYQLAYNIFETMKIGPSPKWHDIAKEKGDKAYQLLVEEKKEKIETDRKKENTKSSGS